MGVRLKGDVDYILELPAKASEAIKPGMLIAVSSGEFAKHGTAGGNALTIFADAPVNAAETDAIPDGQEVIGLVNPQKVKAILATSQTIVLGDPLESAGDGTLKKHTAADEGTSILHLRVVGFALEAVTTTAAVKDILVGRAR